MSLNHGGLTVLTEIVYQRLKLQNKINKNCGLHVHYESKCERQFRIKITKFVACMFITKASAKENLGEFIRLSIAKEKKEIPRFSMYSLPCGWASVDPKYGRKCTVTTTCFALIELGAWNRWLDSILRVLFVHPKYGGNGLVSKVSLSFLSRPFFHSDAGAAQLKRTITNRKRQVSAPKFRIIFPPPTPKSADFTFCTWVRKKSPC